jgi:DNA-binding LytR/AlgR family response regulator
VLLWCLYFVFWILVYRDYYKSVLSVAGVTGIYFVFSATAFYVAVYFLLPRYLYNSRYVLFFLFFVLLLLACASGLATTLYFIFRAYSPEVVSNVKGVFVIALVSIGTMVGVLAAAKLVIEKVRSEQVARRLEKEHLASELQYLKAQVNPHFLFNAINSVYFLIRKNPDHAAETLIRLSDLLRYQLYDCTGDKIAVEKEVEYLKNFIALEKVRKGEKVKVTFEQEGTLSGFGIAPFLLIPFFENAFKYVSNFSTRENTISIVLRREADLFTARIANTTDNVISNGVGGIGLRNVKRRLELLYPGKHQLEIAEDLKIQTIIVEDEPLAREGLLSYSGQVDFLTIRKVCEDALEANQVLAEGNVDLMFLDIQMPRITGIDFLKSLKHPPMVIMTTAYPNFALQGYELDVLDYLVKPFPFDRFLKAVNKARDFFGLRRGNAEAGRPKEDYFFVKCDYRYEKIEFRDILYVEGMENYVVIHTAAQKFVTLLRMKTVEETLPASDFIRIHKSFIVSVRAISSIDGNEMIVSGKRLPISREKKSEILERVIKN